MLAYNDRHAVFTAEGCDNVNESLSTNRVKLSRRLIKQQHLRIHCADRSKVHKLLLTAGKGAYLFFKQLFKREKRRRFRNPQPCFSGRKTEIFKPEKKLAFNRRSNRLKLSILHDKADFFRRASPRKQSFFRAENFNGAAAFSVGRKLRLEHF